MFLVPSCVKYVTLLVQSFVRERTRYRITSFLNIGQGKSNFFHIQLTCKPFDLSNRTTKDLARATFYPMGLHTRHYILLQGFVTGTADSNCKSPCFQLHTDHFLLLLLLLSLTV